MDVLWRTSEAMPVRGVLAELNRDRASPLAYTTVMTVLSRLTERRAVRRKAEGRGYLYEAAVGSSAEFAVRQLLNDYGDAALASFVDHVGGDEELRSRLRRLVEDS